VVGYGFYAAANRGGNGKIMLDVLSQYLWLALWSLPPSHKHATFYDIRPLVKKHPDWFREDLTTLLALLAAGRLRPVIAERLPLAEAARAHQLVEQAAVQGKLVLIPNP
jgi:NADPH:quinone reductase-like Zn-dependent oxidoreductase